MIGHALLAFFLLHLIAGTFLPLAKNIAPFLFGLIENAGREIDRRLNRPMRGQGELFVRGMVVTLVMAGFALLIGCAVWRMAQHGEFGWLASAAFLFLVASVMGPLTLLREVVAALEKSNTEKATAVLQPYFRESLQGADTHTLVRKAIELSAIALDIYFVVPLFWFVLLGAPGAMLSVAAAALARACGGPDLRHRAFGLSARLLDGVLNFIPAVLTAVLLALAAVFVSRSNPFRSFGTAARQARRYKMGWLGWPVAAMAGSLGVTLCGPVKHADGMIVDHGWVGPKDSSARLTIFDLQRAAMIHFVFFLCVMTLSAFGIVMLQMFS